ncbi:MAG: hypothetical protein ABSA79_01725 [Candidatus Bathyarchaeia archaeon]|jgi:hypothetical protein
MLIENEKKEYVKQANNRGRTRQSEVITKTIDNSNEKHRNCQREWIRKHPDYMKEWKSRNKEKQRHYRETWNKKHPNYYREWIKKHPNYMRDCLKERKGNAKGLNAGVTLKTEVVDLTAISESDKSIAAKILKQ